MSAGYVVSGSHWSPRAATAVMMLVALFPTHSTAAQAAPARRVGEPAAISVEQAMRGLKRGQVGFVPHIAPKDIASVSGHAPEDGAFPREASAESGNTEFTPGRTDLVSVANNGSPAEGNSGPSYVSGDGRFVSFLSDAPNLVPGDTNGVVDVFVRDRIARTTEMVSVASDGTIAEGLFGVLGSYWPSMSADGRYVAFMSYAPNLVSGDTNQATDIFVHDRLTDATERVSVADDETEAGNGSLHPAISDDGRHVAFLTFAANLLTPGVSSAGQVVVRDRAAGTTTLVSQSTAGEPGNGFSQLPNISSDGRFVTFQTAATNLSVGDNNGWSDAYIRDRAVGSTERVTFASDGGNPNDQLSSLNQPDVSDDGRYVSFVSRATNLVPGDSNSIGDALGGFDLFVRDLSLDRTQRVSVAGDGAEGSVGSGGLSATMSTDGRLFVFDSGAPNLVAGDVNRQPDVIVHDRVAGANQLASRNSAGNQSNSASGFSAGSADGRHVAFTSYANNLAPGGLDDRFDVFAHDLGPAVGIGGVAVEASSEGVDVSGWINIEGGVFASHSDPAGDTLDGGRTGSDLVDATIAYRPKTADLLFSWRTASLPSLAMPATPEVGTLIPGATASVAAPPLAFVATFQTTGYGGAVETWQVRASGTSANSAFGLFYCAGQSCSRLESLTGGIGTAGHEVRVRVPVTALLFNTSAGDTLANVRAFVTPVAAEIPSPLDSIDLGNAVIPTPQVALGWAPSATQPSEVEFTHLALIIGNRFEATIDGPPRQGDRLWIRACRGVECTLRVGPAPDPSPEAEGSGAR